MPDLENFEELGIQSDEFEIIMEDEPDGGGMLHIDFKIDEAEEIFRAACARAGLSKEEYLKRLILG